MGSGGGGSTTTTVDPIYNAGLLAIAQEDQEFKNTFMNMFQYGVGYDPSEQVRGTYIDGEWVNMDDITPEMAGDGQFVKNPDLSPGTEGKGEWVDSGQVENDHGEGGGWGGYRRWVPDEGIPEYVLNPNYEGLETRTRGEVEGYDPSAQTSEMQYLQNVVNKNQELLGLQTDVSKRELGLAGAVADANMSLLPTQTEATRQQSLLAGEEAQASRRLLPQRTALAETTLSDINKGIDVGARMDEAQAGVQHGFKLAGEASRKDIASFGLDPGSGRYKSQNRDTALKQATGIAGARTKAKNTAEREDFDRKIRGLQLIS